MWLRALVQLHWYSAPLCTALYHPSRSEGLSKTAPNRPTAHESPLQLAPPRNPDYNNRLPASLVLAPLTY